eukprot:GILI01038119.1.p1 GENE.GILI01038119.1~~GILI01038119.1.p1  ORF type:complete len:154 (+),score=5.29 GILI01038119.1:44-505(+)
MLRHTAVCHKNPYVYKFNNSRFSTQLKWLLSKKAVHKHTWDPIPLYNPRDLAHTNQKLDHYTYEPQYDAHREANSFLVPDQTYNKVPVPSEFKDAYWWRDLQSRRVQCPTRWVDHNIYRADRRLYTDFQNLAFQQKFKYRKDDVLRHIKEDLR